MTAYELMIKTNHHLIKGGVLPDAQKRNIVGQLLAARSDEAAVRSFKKSVNAPKYLRSLGQSSDTRVMYPLFYIPPYNGGKKYKTILNQTPKTHILSANMYELEILRLLYLFAPNDAGIKEMSAKTLDRLKTTCFGNEDDGVGECFDTSLVALRFLAVTAPDKTQWMQSRIDNYNRHYADVKRPWFCSWYYWLCLSELPFDIAKPETDKYKGEMLNWLCNKSCVMNSENDRTIHPVLFCMLRNHLARYSEYAYIKDRQPYVSEKDNRLHFDMSNI